jgi:hypothetical protein
VKVETQPGGGDAGRARRLPDLGNMTSGWWGEVYQLCPDELLDELNGDRNTEEITALLRK